MIINRHSRFCMLVCVFLLFFLVFGFIYSSYTSAAYAVVPIAVGAGEILLTVLAFLGVTVVADNGQSISQYADQLVKDLYKYVGDASGETARLLDEFFQDCKVKGCIAVATLQAVLPFIKGFVIDEVWNKVETVNPDNTQFADFNGYDYFMTEPSVCISSNKKYTDLYLLSLSDKTNLFSVKEMYDSGGFKIYDYFYPNDTTVFSGDYFVFLDLSGTSVRAQRDIKVYEGIFSSCTFFNYISVPNSKNCMIYNSKYMDAYFDHMDLNMYVDSTNAYYLRSDINYMVQVGPDTKDIYLYSAATGQWSPYVGTLLPSDIFLPQTGLKALDGVVADSLAAGKSIDDINVVGQDAVLGDAGEVIDSGTLAILGADTFIGALTWADVLAKMGGLAVDDAAPNAGSVVLNPSGVADGTLAGELSVPPPDVSIPGDITGILQKILTALLSIPTILSSILDMLTHFFDVSQFKLDFSGFKTLVLKDKFPFCIPFDFLKAVKIFSVPASDFHLRIDLDTRFFTLHHVIDMSMIALYIKFFRFVASVWYVMFLITRTREFIKW